jgi:Peptidase inhibitor family I36
MSGVAKRGTVVAGALSAIAAAVALTGAATAGVPKPVCEAGELCVYGDGAFLGQLVDLKRPGKVSNALANRMDDAASSVRNRRGRVAMLFANPDGKGERVCIEPRTALPELDALGFADVASSSLISRKRRECAPGMRNGSCDRGELCLWSDAGFFGRIYETATLGRVVTLPGSMADLVSSVRNRRGRIAILFEGPNGEDPVDCIEPRESIDFTAGYNDSVSSIRLSRRASECPAA